MDRKTRFPDTDTFRFFNANPNNRYGGDCVVRAICTALNQTWEQTVRELTEIGIKYGYVLNDKHTYERYLQEKGWTKYKQPRKPSNKKYTGSEFCKSINPNKNYIAHIGGHHIVAIVEGKIQDIWDCSGRCIGNFWGKE